MLRSNWEINGVKYWVSSVTFDGDLYIVEVARYKEIDGKRRKVFKTFDGNKLESMLLKLKG